MERKLEKADFDTLDEFEALMKHFQSRNKEPIEAVSICATFFQYMAMATKGDFAGKVQRISDALISAAEKENLFTVTKISEDNPEQ